MTNMKPLISKKDLLTKSPQEIRKLLSSRKRSRQEQADDAVGTIIEAIQHIACALDDASVAIMYNIPAKGAEPERGLNRLACAKQKLKRALYLIGDEVQRPAAKNVRRTIQSTQS